MSDSWNGEERRKVNQRDHDLLTRIDANLANFMKKFEEHVDNDTRIEREIRNDVKWLQRIAWMGFGAYTLINVLGKFH